jgi:hypothetical protein
MILFKIKVRFLSIEQLLKLRNDFGINLSKREAKKYNIIAKELYRKIILGEKLT